MPVRVGLVTVRTPLPVMLPEMALMVALPAATALTMPELPTVATAGLLLDQVTLLVHSELVLLE